MATRWKSWTPSVIEAAALKRTEQRMQVANQVVVGNVKRLINRGNPRGTNPSAPGEPPKKVTARLFNSIASRVERQGKQVIGIVGSALKYARRLELGFVGRDSLGRNVDQAPRPYLRPGLTMSLQRIKKIIGGGQ